MRQAEEEDVSYVLWTCLGFTLVLARSPGAMGLVTRWALWGYTPKAEKLLVELTIERKP